MNFDKDLGISLVMLISYESRLLRKILPCLFFVISITAFGQNIDVEKETWVNLANYKIASQRQYRYLTYSKFLVNSYKQNPNLNHDEVVKRLNTLYGTRDPEETVTVDGIVMPKSDYEDLYGGIYPSWFYDFLKEITKAKGPTAAQVGVILGEIILDDKNKVTLSQSGQRNTVITYPSIFNSNYYDTNIKQVMSDLYTMAKNNPEVRASANLVLGRFLNGNIGDDVQTMIDNNPNFRDHSDIQKIVNWIDENGNLKVEIEEVKEFLKGKFGALDKTIKDLRNELDDIKKDRSRIANLSQAEYEKQLKDAKREFTETQHIIRGYKASLNIITTIIQFEDAEFAQDLTQLGNMAFGIADAINLFNYNNNVFPDKGFINTAITFSSVIGAVTGLVSYFANKGRPTPHQIIFEQLKVIQKQIVQLGEQMHQRFDIVDQKLDKIYEDMMFNFATVIFKLERLQIITNDIQSNLFDLRDQLFRIETSLQKYFEAAEMRRFEEAWIDCVESKSIGEDITLDEFKSCRNLFFAWAARHSDDPIAIGQLNASGSPDREIRRHFIDSEFDKVIGSLDVNYLGLLAKQRFGYNEILKQGVVANPLVWNKATNAYLALIGQYPEYKFSVPLSRIMEIHSVGRKIESSYKGIFFDDKNDVTGFFDNLMDDYNVPLSSFLKEIEKVEAEFIIDNFPKYTEFNIWEPNELNSLTEGIPKSMEYGNWDKMEIDKAFPNNDYSQLSMNMNLKVPGKFKKFLSNPTKYLIALGIQADSVTFDYTWYHSPNRYRPPRGGFVIAHKCTDIRDGAFLITTTFRKRKVTSYAFQGRQYAGNCSGHIPCGNGHRDYLTLNWNQQQVGRCRGNSSLNEKFFEGAKNVSIPSEVLEGNEMVNSLVYWELQNIQKAYYSKLLLQIDQNKGLNETVLALGGHKRMIESSLRLGLPRYFEKDDNLKESINGDFSLFDKQGISRILIEAMQNIDSLETLHHLFEAKKLEYDSLKDILISLDTIFNKSDSIITFSYNLFTINDYSDFYTKTRINFEKAANNRVHSLTERITQIITTIQENKITINFPLIEENLNALEMLKATMTNSPEMIIEQMPVNTDSLNFSFFFLKDLPSNIERFSNLTHVNVSNNLLKSVPSKLSNTINSLNLSHNTIQGLSEPLPVKLEYLNISNNDLIDYPSQLERMKSLKHLNLTNNDFKRKTKKKIRRRLAKKLPATEILVD